MPFAKLDSGITKSSIWSSPLHIRVVWISFLAEKDESGFVAASRSGMIRICNVTEQQFDEAISVLESPDDDSRTPDNEGRRIEKIEGGWIVLNHDKYRLSDDIQRVATRERVRKFREKKKQETLRNVTPPLPSVSVSVSGSVSGSDPEGDCKGETKPKWFSEFWNVYPKKVGKGAAEKAWSKITNPAESINLIKRALEWQKTSEQWQKDNGQFIPNPATYINQRRWEDEKPSNESKYGFSL